MRKVILMLAAACAAACAATPRSADGDAAAVEAFMRAYSEAWNRHDAAVIARDFYRLGRSDAEQAAELERGFAALRAEGYSHSVIHRVEACMAGPDAARAGMVFTRLRTDETAMPPDPRASAYGVVRFADGWRITSIAGWEPSAGLGCSAAG
jgi:hypothetical protein